MASTPSQYLIDTNDLAKSAKGRWPDVLGGTCHDLRLVDHTHQMELGVAAFGEDIAWPAPVLRGDGYDVKGLLELIEGGLSGYDDDEPATGRAEGW